MKTPLWASLCAFAFFAFPATGADYSLRSTLDAPPVPEPPGRTSWTSFYFGGQIGYASDHVNGTGWYGNQISALANNSSRSGFLGGGFVGGLYELSHFNLPIVFGVEADLGGSSIKNSVLRFSVRARAGYAYERLLVYATGGLAVSDFQYNFVDGNGALVSNNTVTSAGWVIGAGVEYAFTDDLSARLEYRYSDFSGVSLPDTNGGAGISRSENSIMTGVSYHFNMEPPSSQRVSPIIERDINLRNIDLRNIHLRDVKLSTTAPPNQ